MFLLTAAVCAAGDWDRSSLAASGRCLSDGALQVTITNNGASMMGAVAYRFVVNGEVVACGAVQLGAGDQATLLSMPYPGQRIEFSVDQRPGHPGEGIVWVRSACSPTAVTLTGLTAGGDMWSLVRSWLRR